MSDVMLLGVLRMPIDCWAENKAGPLADLDRKQRHARYVQAADRIESDGLRLAELEAERDRLAEQLAEARAENERLREKHKVFHRRIQQAEAAIPSYEKLLAVPPNGDGIRFVSGSLGRAMLASYVNKLWEERKEARAENKRLMREVGVLRSYMRSCDEYAADNAIAAWESGEVEALAGEGT